ncbi:uncharacterized protein LOC128883815 isoform X2 [Hylaeus volcanicus]|uniref:uncharacterized protein LOC128883815 isoform X2 n=1 Tax=Hylaeus volcanicus TaxID=313075 RepID=UPI0023B83F40|nr:uncharacterized protein LOC128883815 isoform X2 [Hylaeus volcanicus]
MNVVKSTAIVADELNEINSLIDIRARKLRVKERELKDKIKAFKIWEKDAYEALRHHAETLMRHAILRIKNIVEKQASQAKTVLDTSESVMNLCSQQKSQIEKLFHAAKEPQRLLKEYKSRLDSERRRGKFLRRRVTQIEKENNRLRDMCQHETFSKEATCNVTATTMLDSTLNGKQISPSFNSPDNVYKTHKFVSQQIESSPHISARECQVLCKNNSSANYGSLLEAEEKSNKGLPSKESSNCHLTIAPYKCRVSGYTSPHTIKESLRLVGDVPSFFSREKENKQGYEWIHEKKKHVDLAQIIPKVSNFSICNQNFYSLQREKALYNYREEPYEKSISVPGHLNMIQRNVFTNTKRQSEQLEGLGKNAGTEIKQKSISRQVLLNPHTLLGHSTQLKKKTSPKQRVDRWTIKKLPGLPYQPNAIKSMGDLKKQDTKIFDFSREDSSSIQRFLQYGTTKEKSSQFRSVTLPPAFSFSRPKRNGVNSLSIPPTMNALRNNRMFTALPQIDSDRQIVESATMLQKLAHRIKIKKMLQSVKL